MFIFKILFFICVQIGSLYPLFIWIDGAKHLDISFYRFHTLFSTFFVALAFGLDLRFSLFSSVYMLLWFYQMIIVSALSWQRRFVRPWLICLPCLWGIFVLFVAQSQFFHASLFQHFLLIISGLAFVGCAYAGVLGHWYLNMKGLSLSFLKKGVYFYSLCIVMRLFLSLFVFFRTDVLYRSELYSVFEFLKVFEGLFLCVALILAVFVFPCLAAMIIRVLSYKNTQATTGLLYVHAALFLMSEFFFKYYAFQYQLII